MFGVLIVQTPENKIGYLAAFSGTLASKSIILSSSHQFMICYNHKDSSK